MAWSATSFDSRFPLVVIRGILTSLRYVDDILRTILPPFLLQYLGLIFEQGRVRPHTAGYDDDQDHQLEQIWQEIPQETIGVLNRSKPRRVSACIQDRDGDRFNRCQVIYSQFGLAIHQNDHQARRRFVEWAQNEIAVVPDFHKQILFSDEAHFWLNGYANKQNCHIWSEANPQVYVKTPLHPEKLTVWCALWAGGIFLQKR
ncbi:uncharacterized protein TNCV_926141 [Trichonephila clavipes]|nr:uncharacterized protein TNCV_926141 [Trichonephila clavipes]